MPTPSLSQARELSFMSCAISQSIDIFIHTYLDHAATIEILKHFFRNRLMELSKILIEKRFAIKSEFMTFTDVIFFDIADRSFDRYKIA